MNSRPPPYQGGALPLSYLGLKQGRLRSNPRRDALSGLLRRAGARLVAPPRLACVFERIRPCFWKCLFAISSWALSLLTKLGVLGAGDRIRTGDVQLGRLTLYQLSYSRRREPLWRVVDSNHRRYKPADLQSAPFGHSGNPPKPLHIPTSWRRDLNPQPPVYKTGALPLSYASLCPTKLQRFVAPRLPKQTQLRIRPDRRGRVTYDRRGKVSSTTCAAWWRCRV